MRRTLSVRPTLRIRLLRTFFLSMKDLFSISSYSLPALRHFVKFSSPTVTCSIATLIQHHIVKNLGLSLPEVTLNPSS